MHYDQDQVRDQCDYKAISQNGIRSTTGNTDQLYSNADGLYWWNRIDSLFRNRQGDASIPEEYKDFLDFLAG
jgi:hypothetical protein